MSNVFSATALTLSLLATAVTVQAASYNLCSVAGGCRATGSVKDSITYTKTK